MHLSVHVACALLPFGAVRQRPRGALDRAQARLGNGPNLRVVTTFAGAMQGIAQWSPAALMRAVAPTRSA